MSLIYSASLFRSRLQVQVKEEAMSNKVHCQQCFCPRLFLFSIFLTALAKEIFSNKSPPSGTKDYLRGWKKILRHGGAWLERWNSFRVQRKELDEGGGEWGGARTSTRQNWWSISQQQQQEQGRDNIFKAFSSRHFWVFWMGREKPDN